MVLGEIKDVVRELLGNQEISLPMLTYIVESGWREVEKRVNAYWMLVRTDFNLSIGEDEYPLTSGTINRPAFKDLFLLLYKASAATVWNFVEHRGHADAVTRFDTASDGTPTMAIVDNALLNIFPEPDVAYNMRMYAFEWTTPPTDNVAAGLEMMIRFPEALIYASVWVGTKLLTKNEELAKPWEAMLLAQVTVINAYSNNRIKLPK